MKELANQIVAWLTEYATKNNRKAFVVGISGGVDSALVSTLCARTGIPTRCVILPCHSRPDGIENAQKHLKWLQENFDNVSGGYIDLTSTFDAFKATLDGNYASDLADANAKSRLRMIALYQVATAVDGLVVGTGNKVEDFGVGFFTKYGDGGVDISPIADLMKTEVRQMCRELEVLPELSEAVPTDGLWADNRSDETAIGATYEELEWAMFYEANSLPGVTNELHLSDRQKEVLTIYRNRHAATLHKITPIPTFKRDGWRS